MGRPTLPDKECPKCGSGEVRSKRTRSKTGRGNPLRNRQRYLFCLNCKHKWKEPIEQPASG